MLIAFSANFECNPVGYVCHAFESNDRWKTSIDYTPLDQHISMSQLFTKRTLFNSGQSSRTHKQAVIL